MFLGSVPVRCIEQVFRIIDFSAWPETFVCCSGSFRVDRALRARFPEMRIFSNDVALYSSALGYAAAGQSIPIEFIEDLAFIEPLLKDASFADRVAAVLVVCEMSRYARKNAYAKAHFAHYVLRFADFLAKAKVKVGVLVETLRLDGYFAGDWRKHVDTAIERGAGIVAFPPFFRGDYEHQYKFIDKNTRWPAPAYDIYNPSMLHEIVDRIDASASPYCVLTDQMLPGRTPVLEFVSGRKVPHYCFARTERSSLRHLHNRAAPFKYTPVDVAKLTLKSRVDLVPARPGQANFLKDVYLAKSIVHTPGIAEYLIFIDRMLVGCIIYALNKYPTYGPGSIYLLSDVTVSREAKLSKLVALMATSDEVLRLVGAKLIDRITLVVTTARTKNPVSMKYRGIYELRSRKTSAVPGEGNMLQYASKPRPETLTQLYQEWFRKYVKA